MPAASSNVSSSARDQALYRATVQEAAAGGSLLMGKLVAAARTHLQAREAACRDLRERDALAQSSRQLRSWEAELCTRFPLALLDAFTLSDAPRLAGAVSAADVAFDELELMDDLQVLTSVALARTQQVALLAAEASLAELNTLVCGTLGLVAVNPERNPLRPQNYVNALRAVIEQTQLAPAIQLDWLGAMSATLGQELRGLYAQVSATLKRRGVAAAGYAVTPTHTSVGSGVGRGVAQQLSPIGASPSIPLAPVPSLPTDPTMATAGKAQVRVKHGAAAVSGYGQDDTLLTLDKLRRLLAGELDTGEPLTAKEQFAQRFAQEFEPSGGQIEEAATDFDATVPAALEALKEMEQVDAVVQRLQRRRGSGPSPVLEGDTSVEAARAKLRSQAQGVGQALSLEVITLMVDNIAHDERLLPPVQQLIRRLEPALLRLALVDPRLFTNRQHPARILVQEIAHHSLAYGSVEAHGLSEFLAAVAQAVAPLDHVVIENAEPFEVVLSGLQDGWRRAARASARRRAAAMHALQNAEQRNVLAERIAREIIALPDAARVPEVVIDFLCGPWAQVLAQARLAGDRGAGTAEKFQALISALLWSAHPELARKNTTKLTRLIPLLLGTLREGLETIHYPATKTSTFLEALMGLHQQAFRSAHHPSAAAPLRPSASQPRSARPNLVEDGNPWVAPEEAAASNFMDGPEPEAGEATVRVKDAQSVAEADTHGPTLGANDLVSDELPIGSWVELWVHDQWTRTQLSWASPHGTLFLFTSAGGASQSMTRRSRDKLMAAGQLRVISAHPMVDGALNAVAQMALRNSVNTFG